MKENNFSPLIVLIVCLSIFGIAVYKRAQLSVHPPFWDSFSYVQKSKNFWEAASALKWFNPLNLEPTIRGTGTVLMSYPLGFSNRFQGFYFRSVFIPLLFFVTGLWVVTIPYCTDMSKKWILVCLCLAFSTIPMFYQFENSDRIPTTSFWGLVDCYLAGVSAFACALIVRSVYRKSLPYIFFGVASSAFCLWIKPAAMVLMVVNFIIWAGCAVKQFIPAVKRPIHRMDQSVSRYLLISLVLFTITYGIVFFLSLHSMYLAPENWTAGKRSMELLHKEWFIENWFPLFKTQIHTSFGWHWLAIILSTWVLSIKAKNIRIHFPDILLAAGVLFSGLWFWFVPTGQSQTRYFYPFILISVILSTPRTLLLFSRIVEKNGKFIAIVLTLPFFLLLSLMLSDDSSLQLQKAMGVNLTSGSLKEEVEQSQAIIDESRKQSRDLAVYFFWPDYLHGVFYGAAQYAKFTEPNKPSFAPIIPVNWINDSTLRFSDIAGSDYLVFSPIIDNIQQSEAIQRKEISSFWAEVQLLRTVLSKYDQSIGLKFISKTSLMVLKVVDRQRFSVFLDQLKSEHQWRKCFAEANSMSK